MTAIAELACPRCNERLATIERHDGELVAQESGVSEDDAGNIVWEGAHHRLDDEFAIVCSSSSCRRRTTVTFSPERIRSALRRPGRGLRPVVVRGR